MRGSHDTRSSEVEWMMQAGLPLVVQSAEELLGRYATVRKLKFCR